MFEGLNKKNQQENVHLLSVIGCIYAKLGNAENANEKIREIRKLKDNHPYYVARIQAALGEKENAMNSLRQSKNLYWPEYYNNDFELISLFDYPPFQEFIKQKG